MSHGHERKEKDCLNCGTIVQGRYCQACGQENTEPHETFFGMVNHFFSDITHFDGKFFKTIGVLARKPGFLSRQYIAGKRNSYLHPVRMYVFTASLFFLLFFAFYSVKENSFGIGRNESSGNVASWVDSEAYADAKTTEDSIEVERFVGYYRPGTDTTKVKKKKGGVAFGSGDYESLRQYDSLQAALPKSKRDNWLETMLVRKGLDMKERYPGQEGRLTADILNKFFHTLPYLLFVSLPLYGFFLYLLYIRRKDFFFADHAIFLIHLYVFTFILLILFGLMLRVPYSWMNFLKAALIIYGIIYTVIAFKNFYRQRWGKTIFKFILFNFICLVSLTFLFIVFFGYALFQV